MYLYNDTYFFENLCGANGEACDLEDIEMNIAEPEELVDYLNESCPDINNCIKKATCNISIDYIDYEDGTDGCITVILYSDIELTESQLNSINEAMENFNDDFFSIYTNIEFNYYGKEKE